MDNVKSFTKTFYSALIFCSVLAWAIASTALMINSNISEYKTEIALDYCLAH